MGNLTTTNLPSLLKTQTKNVSFLSFSEEVAVLCCTCFLAKLVQTMNYSTVIEYFLFVLGNTCL